MDPEGQIMSRGGQMKRIKSIYGIPENAIILDENQVLRMHWKMVTEWKPRSEMWPFIHGQSALGCFAALGGMVCNNHFRAKFDLRHLGRVPTYLAAIAVPGALAVISHNLWVANPYLLGRFDCLLCAQIRSGSIQAALGALYPLLLAPPMAIVIARKHWTYPIPKVTQPKEVVNMLYKTANPFKYVFATLVMTQFLLGALVAKHEYRVFETKLSTGMLPPPTSPRADDS